MINLQAILTANGTAIMLLLILTISTRKNTRHELFDDKMYYLMVAITVLQCVVESSAFLVDGRTEPIFHTLNLILNAGLYINNIIFAFCWTVYADFKLFESKERLKKVYPFVAIPAILIVIAAIINLFTPIFFTISSANIYQRTSLYFIPYGCTYLYLLYGVVLIYAYRNKVQKYLFLPAVVFMLPILVCSVIQYFYYGVSLVWVGVSVALVSLYVNVQNETTYIDELSGLLTRKYLSNYLKTETKKTNIDTKLVGIMLDIDQFKKINDTYGHLIGDQAITSAGRILLSCVVSKGFAVRYAGDEFVVIMNVKDESEIEEMMQKIQEETERFNQTGKQPYKLHFSIGYSIFQYGDDTTNTFFGAIDAAMYEDKRRRS